MKKESFIVGIFGLSLGLLVAWAIWNFKSAAPQPQQLTLSPSPSIVPVITSAPSSSPSLTIKNPQDEDIATQSSILVSGSAKPGSTVVISTNLDDFVLTVQDGNFSQNVNLEEGENILTVTSYDSDKNKLTAEKTVIYAKDVPQ